jgi:SAD/SRA domain
MQVLVNQRQRGRKKLNLSKKRMKRTMQDQIKKMSQHHLFQDKGNQPDCKER